MAHENPAHNMEFHRCVGLLLKELLPVPEEVAFPQAFWVLADPQAWACQLVGV